MPKINVYLPDNLSDQIEQTNDLNVSKVCQDALKLEIEKKKVIASTPRVTEEVIERLRKSKKDRIDRALELGEQNGRKWALEKADFDELKDCAEMYRTFILLGNTLPKNKSPVQLNLDYANEVTKGWTAVGVENVANLVKSRGKTLNKDSFISGWFFGVYDVLNEVKNVVAPHLIDPTNLTMDLISTDKPNPKIKMLRVRAQK